MKLIKTSGIPTTTTNKLQTLTDVVGRTGITRPG